MRHWLWIVALGCLITSRVQARIERFAVIIGNDRGALSETPLQYAEVDAMRVYDVLLGLGEVSPLNSVVLRGRDAGFVRGALLSINERIREVAAQPDTQVVLIVYFSGHADAQSLHLDGSELPLAELRQLARGSAADFRLVVLDACRSGALTRVKGAKRIPAFSLPESVQANLPSDGVAFLTASSAHEDAQESDELQSSFFTHAFVTGLLGAADADGDGDVVLNEAYRYAYEATLRATSRTLAGTQHPTFQYDLRGRGELVLTRPKAHTETRASVSFPAGLGYMLLRDSESGRVAVELEPSAQTRFLSLEPGRYFVRARGTKVMYEGLIAANSGSSFAIDLSDFERFDYARLTRKGGPEARIAHGLALGGQLRTALPNSSEPCSGLALGYALEGSQLGARARLGACVSQLYNDTLQAQLTSYDLDVQLYHSWQLSRMSFDIGAGAGASVFTQRFETRGVSPTRVSAAPFLSLGLGGQLTLSGGYFVDLHCNAETYFMRVRDETREVQQIAFALRTALSVGSYF